MYETYFNLAERPFASVPRTDHYYPAGVIDAARNTLTRCVDRGEGVALIVGPSGTGKSILCQVLAERFQKSFQVALLASTYLDTRRSLLQAILYELNRPYRGMDEGELRLSLVDYITLDDDCPGGALLLVDEAHHLPMRLLDELRALTNLTRSMQPAVRMVLAGNHVLEERFASPKLESFTQRISARCYLEAFQRDETQAYIWARIMVSGGRGSDVFPVDACRMVHKATGGVPRLINQVCDHVLLLAYTSGLRRIEAAHVEEAWADLQQLPTPWNAPATSPAGDGLIEFGGLDDDPLEMQPIAGKIVVEDDLEDDGDAEDGETEAVAEAVVAVAEVPMDAETSRQLRNIRRLLADVREEFLPGTSQRLEIELYCEAPHPFEEPFEEEEVIAERFPSAAPAAPPAAAAIAVAPLPAMNVTSLKPAPTVTVATAKAAEKATEAEPCDGAIPQANLPADRKYRIDPPAQSVVPPPRKQLGRLFAGLRRGL